MDLERTAFLLEFLARQGGRHVARSDLRRSLEESRAAWNAVGSEQWWRPFLEAAEGLELRIRIAEGKFADLVDLLSDGAKVILPTRSHGLVVCERQSATMTRLTGPAGTKNVLREKLSLDLEETGGRCLFLIVTSQQLNPAQPNASPLNRLYGLMLPELGDVLTVSVYALVTGLLALATPLAVEALVNTVAFGKFFQPVIILSLILFAFLAFAAALKGLQNFVVEILQRRLFARIASDTAYRLPRAKLESLDGISARELVNQFLEVVTVQKVAAQFLLDGVSLVLGTMIGMAVLAFYHPWLLGFDLLLLLLIIFGMLVLGRGAVGTSIKESKTKYHTLAWLEEVASCPLAVRYGGVRQFVLERTDEHVYEYLKARRAHFRILMRQIAFALGLQAVASTVLLGLGGWLVIQQQLSLGQLVASELIVTTIVGAFAKLGKHMESYYDLMAAVDKLGGLFDLPMEDPTGLLTFPNDRPAEVDVNDVSYSAPGGGPVLKNLRLYLEPGARVCVRGPSGSGKSLLVDLLFGIRKPESGHITVGGIDTRDFRPDAYRQRVTLARDIEVFEGTVAENVHLGRDEISLLEIRQSLASVGLLDDLLNLPDGLNTHLGPMGTPLTSNQLRRLMLARAIVGRPRLLLIDGLLDSLSEAVSRELLAMLARSDQPWTLIVITGHSSLSLGMKEFQLSPQMQQLTEEETNVQ